MDHGEVGRQAHVNAQAYADFERLVAAYETSTVRLHRAEWGRLLIAAAMVLTMIGEMAAVLTNRLTTGLPYWLVGTYLWEALMLHIATKGVNAIRTITFDLWKACWDARFAMMKLACG